MVESASLNVQAGWVIRHWKVDVFFSFSPCPQNVSDLGEGELLDWFSSSQTLASTGLLKMAKQSNFICCRRCLSQAGKRLDCLAVHGISPAICKTWLERAMGIEEKQTAKNAKEINRAVCRLVPLRTSSRRALSLRTPINKSTPEENSVLFAFCYRMRLFQND